jgi:hypothetical protein
MLQLSAATLSFVDRCAIVPANASRTLPTTLILAALMVSNKRHSTFTFFLRSFTWIISLSVGLHLQIFKHKDASSDYLTNTLLPVAKKPLVNVCHTKS